MPSQLEIRICRESFIQEFERMYHPSRIEYFTQVAQKIEKDPLFNITALNLSSADYERFMNTIRRFKDPQLGYYSQTSSLLRDLLQLKDVRIWTKKETLELQEAVTESTDLQSQKLFTPLFKNMEHGQAFLCLLKEG